MVPWHVDTIRISPLLASASWPLVHKSGLGAEKGQSYCHGSDEFVLLLPFRSLGPPFQPPLLPGSLGLLLPLPVGQVSLQWERREGPTNFNQMGGSYKCTLKAKPGSSGKRFCYVNCCKDKPLHQ